MTNRFDGADKLGVLIVLIGLPLAIIVPAFLHWRDTGSWWPPPAPSQAAEVERPYQGYPYPTPTPWALGPNVKMRCYDRYDTANPDNNKEVDCDLMRKVPLPTPTPAPTPHQFENPTNGFPRTYSIREI